MQARKDCVMRLEVSEDVLSVTLHGGSAENVWRTLEAAHQAGGPDIGWFPQLGVSRHCGVDPSSDGGAAAGSRDLPDARPLRRRGCAGHRGLRAHLLQGRAAGLRPKAYVGEWGTADDVWRAVEVLELDEVQHGIAASTSPKVIRALADASARLNVCPTSNVMLDPVTSLREHLIRALFDADVKVTLGTDDPLLFSCTPSGEFMAVNQAGVMTDEELDAIRLAPFE